MKKRYIILFIFIGIFCFQFFLVERSEYVAGQNRCYTYYEKYFDNEINSYSSSAYDNDTYNLERITDKIISSYNETDKIRIDLKNLYENLNSDDATLDYYKSSLYELGDFENKIVVIGKDLKLYKNHLRELNQYINKSENELKSKFFYTEEIELNITKVIKIDSILNNYSNISNRLASNVQIVIKKTEEEQARIERERKRQRRLIQEQRLQNSLSQYNSSNNTTYPTYSYRNTSVRVPDNFYNSKRTSSSVKYYTNTDGYRVQSPTHYNSQPRGATALCNDGTYSFSRNRRGTCSGHGGVRKWL